MTGNERRNEIIAILSKSQQPIAARILAEELHVSRQVIVTDIALLRAEKYDILSTSRGYILEEPQNKTRVFKMVHNDEDAEAELNIIVDFGGAIEDVFVYHKLYGIVRSEMNIRSRKDVQDFLLAIKEGKSSFLKNITSNYHYHTISAPSEKILDMIFEELNQKGFLAQLQDYEPVDFWQKKDSEEK